MINFVSIFSFVVMIQILL